MKYVKPLTLFQDLLKRSAADRGRLIGLDVGDKYVGLAVSDAKNRIASPLSVLVRKKSNIDLMAADFENLVHALSLTGFIFGYPFDRRKNTPEAVQVKLLIDDLCKTGKLKDNVEFFLSPFNLPPVLHKTIMDKFAAVGILQGYLDYVNRREKLKVKD